MFSRATGGRPIDVARENEPLIGATGYGSSDATAQAASADSVSAAVDGAGHAGGGGRDSGALSQLPSELDFLRPSMSTTVESAEEILQAVEMQLEHSPLLSRRASVSMSASMRAATTRPVRPPASSGTPAGRGGTGQGSPPSRGGYSATTLGPAAVPSLPPGSSIAASSRGSSLGGAPPHLVAQLPSAVGSGGSGGHAMMMQPGPGSGAALLEQYLQVQRAAAAAAAADAYGAGGGGPQAVGREALLTTSASFSAGVFDATCDAAAAAVVSAAAGGAAASRAPTASARDTPSAATMGTDAAWRDGGGGRGVGGFVAMAAAAAVPSAPGPIAASVPSALPTLAAVSAGYSGGDGRGGRSRLGPPAPRGHTSQSGPRQPGGGGGGSGAGEKKVAIAGVRTWLQVLPDGSASIVQLDRAQLGFKYGVQLRDFRVLDPVLGATYPACLLCREGALIVNLDHIKVIITAQFALVNHSESDKARPFTDELKRRLQSYASTKALAALAAEQRQQQAAAGKGSSGGAGEGGANGTAAGGGGGHIPRSSSTPTLTTAAAGGPSATAAAAAAPPAASGTGTALSFAQGPIAHVASALLSMLPSRVAVGAAGGTAGTPNPSHHSLTPHHGLLLPPLPAPSGPSGMGGGGGEGHVSELVASMPFELRALEVVLEQTVSLLDGQTTELERATRMALDELTLRVNPRNLERMRHLKGRMAALDSKVDTVRGVLEKLLDDDRAMADMNLGAREEEAAEAEAARAAQQQQAAMAAAAAAAQPQLFMPTPLRPPSTAGSLVGPLDPLALGGGAGILLQPGGVGGSGLLQHMPSGGGSMVLGALGGPRGSSPQPFDRMSGQPGYGHGGGDGGEPDSEEVAVVEMLLEAYFMQLGHTWQRLQSLKSYIDSTEDLINLELDQQRNNLISVDLMVTFASFLLTAMSVIAGLFGMNLTNRLESDYGAFLSICIGSAAAAMGLWLLFVYGSIRYGLMNGLSMTWR